MEDYFAESGRITLGVHIVDARHKPTGDDVTMAEWFKASGRPFVVVANKCDKISKTAAAANIALIRETPRPRRGGQNYRLLRREGRREGRARGRDFGAAVTCQRARNLV